MSNNEGLNTVTGKIAKENYEAVANDAIANQVTPKEKPEGVNIMDSELQEQEQAEDLREDTFTVKASDYSSLLSEGINGGIVKAFGENKCLNEEEKQGFNDIFERAANYYGLNKEVSGSMGFIFALLGQVIKVLLPRANDAEAMEHLKENYLQQKEEQEEDGNLQSIQYNADGTRATAAATN